MLNPIVSGVVYAFDMLIIYVFFSRASDKRFLAYKCLLVGLLIFEMGSVINLLFQNNLWINTIASVVIRICFALLCFRLRPFQAVGYSVVLVVINFALELVSVLVISTITKTDPVDYNTNLPLLIVECSTCKILLFLTCLVLSHVVVPNTSWSKHQLSIVFFPVAASICLAIFWYICLQDSISPTISYLLATSSIIIFGSTVLLFLTYQHQIEKDSEWIRMKSENDKLLTEKSYYDILEQQNQQLMVYVHDAKNHLYAIQSLNTNPAIENYTTALLDQLKNYSGNCHSGNMMLDVIINKYVLDCDRRNIRFNYYVRTCNLKGVEDIDLVAVLGNLLDNAVAAAEKSAERTISLETTIRNGYNVVIITNSCDVMPSTRGGHLITDKEDKKLHGYGLKSVSRTLKKYKGDYSWEFDEHEHLFIVTAMIEQNKSSQTMEQVAH